METEETLDYKVALLVDGPNMFKMDNIEIAQTAERYGRVMVKEVFLTKEVSSQMIEFFVNSGYQPIINSIKDVDTSLAIRATEIICSHRYDLISLIAIASRDGDFVPLLQKSRLYDKRVLVIGPENGNGMSYVLKKNADYFETVKER
jgi:uncharacterized protein (TIGR00288 family)